MPILIFFVSCKNTEPKIEPKKIIGSWKMQDVVDQTGQNVTEKTTFYKDSVVFEMFANKKLIERLCRKYEFDTISNVVHYNFGTQTVDLQILKLTECDYVRAS